MIPAADILALVRALRAAVTDEQAFGLLIDAIDRGLGWREAAAAWREWQSEQASTVITLEGDVA